MVSSNAKETKNEEMKNSILLLLLFIIICFLENVP